MHVLRSLEQRLDRFDDTLLKYANMVLNLNKDEEEGEEGQDAKTVSTEKENLPLSVPKGELLVITYLKLVGENLNVML